MKNLLLILTPPAVLLLSILIHREMKKTKKTVPIGIAR